MKLKILAVVAGLAFVLFGRWVYRNPRSVYPGWLYTNPDAQILKSVVRAFGLLLIFEGSYGAVSACTSGFMTNVLVILTALVAASIATWILRPRQVGPTHAIDTTPRSAANASATSLTKKGKHFVVVIVLLSLGALVVVLVWMSSAH